MMTRRPTANKRTRRPARRVRQPRPSSLRKQGRRTPQKTSGSRPDWTMTGSLKASKPDRLISSSPNSLGNARCSWSTNHGHRSNGAHIFRFGVVPAGWNCHRLCTGTELLHEARSGCLYAVCVGQQRYIPRCKRSVTGGMVEFADHGVCAFTNTESC